MEDGGFIKASWTAEGRAAPRKYYDLTDSGAARLARLRTDWQQLVAGMSQILKECK
ncbi:MAG: PadR family transcriptional regulator [Gemmatimonadales bacterium]